MNASLPCESSVLCRPSAPRSRPAGDVSFRLSTRSLYIVTSILNSFLILILKNLLPFLCQIMVSNSCQSRRYVPLSEFKVHLNLIMILIPEPGNSVYQRCKNNPDLTLTLILLLINYLMMILEPGDSVPALHQRPQCQRGAVVCHQCRQRWECHNW